MGNWMVEHEHINVLIYEGLRGLASWHEPLQWTVPDDGAAPCGYRIERLTAETADRVGQMLLDQNAESVNYWWEGASDGLVRHEVCRRQVYHYQPPRYTSWLAVEILKAIECYEYQSCDPPGWGQSEAYAFCRALEQAMFKWLPGYGEAETWGITTETRPLHARRSGVKR